MILNTTFQFFIKKTMIEMIVLKCSCSCKFRCHERQFTVIFVSPRFRVQLYFVNEKINTIF